MTNSLKLFREIIADSLKNNAKSTNTPREKCVKIFSVKAVGV